MDTKKAEKEKKKKKIPLLVKVFLGILAAAVAFLIFAMIFGDDEIEPVPDQTDDLYIGEITIADITNNIVVIEIGDISIEITAANGQDEENIAKKESEAPVASGKTNDGSSFVGSGNEVIVTNGKDKIKGTVTTKNANVDPAKTAAVISASLAPQPYDEKTNDFTTKQAIYFAEIADCNIYYPAQMKLAKKSADALYFADGKSGSELYVKFTPLKDANKGAASVTAEGHSTKTVKGDYVIEAFSAVGNGYLVEATLYYPDKFSYVYDVLKKLIRTEFMEQNTASYIYTESSEDSNTEMQSIYYPDYDCCITIPLEFEEIRNEGSIIYFKDNIRDHLLTLMFADLSDGTDTNNILDVFEVVAEDDSIRLTENSVLWTNGKGIHLGAANASRTALIEIDGADSADSFADSLERWDITFTDNSMSPSYADKIREDIMIDLLDGILTKLSEIEELYEFADFSDMIRRMSDPGDDDMIGNMSDPGDDDMISNMSDPGDDDMISNMSDPGNADIEEFISLSNYALMQRDPNSLLNQIHFDMYDDDTHDEWDGDICRISFWNEEDILNRYHNNIRALLNNGFGIIFEDTDPGGNAIVFMRNDENIGVWARYGIGASIVLFRCDEEPVKEREPRKIYFSAKLKKAFLDDILPDTETMIDFTNDVNNIYNSINNYWVDMDVPAEESCNYFYELDRRSDGGFTLDVFAKNDTLSHIGTFVYVDYTLYKVENNGRLTFLN